VHRSLKCVVCLFCVYSTAKFRREGQKILNGKFTQYCLSPMIFHGGQSLKFNVVVEVVAERDCFMINNFAKTFRDMSESYQQ